MSVGGFQGFQQKHKFGHKNRSHGHEEVILQITSLADVFTILLVFLLKSTASSPVPTTPPASVQLPISAAAPAQSGAAAKPGTRVEIAATGISVEGEFVTKLEANRVPAAESKDARARLDIAFKKIRERQKWLLEQGADMEANTKMLLVADRHIPYDTLEMVWEAAGAQGFSEVQLLTAVKE